MTRLLPFLFSLFLCGVCAADDHTQYVDPFIGTQTDDTGALSGSTFPGACVPFGLVQVSPDTEYNVTWDPCSGYDYNKNTIYGITHTHLSGTGCTDLLDLSLMPFTAELSPTLLAQHAFAQTFSHADEGATPGYYWVRLGEAGVKVELTATEHCAVHRYTFPEGAPQHVVIDLGKTIYNGPDAYYIEEGQRRYDVVQGQLRLVDDHTIEGYRLVTGWAPLRRVYFHIEFSQPFSDHLLMDDARSAGHGTQINGKLLRAALTFAADEPLIVKVALSAVDAAGARANAAAEAAGWDFDSYRQQAHDLWAAQLATIDITGSDDEKRIFYTGMYHTMTQPNVMSDVDGRYVTPTYDIAQLPAGEKYYSTFSLWDTFRAAHPLYNLLYPTMAAAFINSMLLHQHYYGYLPIWHLWGQENYCMIGNHALPVIARAILTGIGGFDVEEAYSAMVASATLSHKNSPFDVWEEYGYMPEPLQSQSVSITLEQAFDDWCVYAVADRLGKAEAPHFAERAAYYRNLFDDSIGFFAPKDEQGAWIRPFNPLAYGDNGGEPFTEGNAWQYLWFVPHDPQGLITLLGGEEKFLAKLDENFSLDTPAEDLNENASAFIGQYAHGNEPSHHTAYLYNFAQRPWRTQELIATIRTKFYNDKPYGYAGNDDCGQMSAWYIFSALGFYPFNAGADDFVIGTPLFTRATLHLPNGKTLTINAPRKSNDDIYVKQVALNGRPLRTLHVTQQELLEGGTMDFVMTRHHER